MGQRETITFLKENRNEWFTAKQLAEKLKLSLGSLSTSLKKLRQGKQTEFKIIRKDTHTRGKKNVFAYKFKD